jgi:Mg-chelatase subunit ChlD
VSPTATLTASATPLGTLTELPPPSPTPCHQLRVLPRPIYLPIVVSEQCRALPFTDVTLVLDMSTSMRDHTPDGRLKLAAAQDAALDFIGQMVLSPDAGGDSDRVAVVGFNRGAWIQQQLTRDRALLAAAVERLPAGVQEITRLDLAIAVGASAALADPRPNVKPVVLLLTDGLPNQVPPAEDGSMDSTVLRAAAAAKAAGVGLYTIGFGRSDGPTPTLYAALMRQIATTQDRYHEAPDAATLAAIYRELSAAVRCPGQSFWPRP